MSAAPRAHAHDGGEKVGVLLVNLGTRSEEHTSELQSLV